MPAAEWLASRGGGKSHDVQVSPELESWNAALAVGIPIQEWLELDPLFKAMILGYYRAKELHALVMETIRYGND